MKDDNFIEEMNFDNNSCLVLCIDDVFKDNLSDKEKIDCDK